MLPLIESKAESQEQQAQTQGDLSDSLTTLPSSHLDEGDANPSTLDDGLGFGTHTVNLVHVALFTNGLILAMLSIAFLCFRLCWKQIRKKAWKGRTLANVI